MDYKYIEQLLERYWECQTTIEEEGILRAFFSQADIPASLLEYRPLFVYENAAAKESIRDGFDEKILAMVGEGEPVKAKRISFAGSLAPLFKAAAVVAIVLTLGNASQALLAPEQGLQSIGIAGYERVDGMKMAERADSAVIDTVKQSSLVLPVSGYE